MLPRVAIYLSSVVVYCSTRSLSVVLQWVRMRLIRLSLPPASGPDERDCGVCASSVSCRSWALISCNRISPATLNQEASAVPRCQVLLQFFTLFAVIVLGGGQTRTKKSIMLLHIYPSRSLLVKNASWTPSPSPGPWNHSSLPLRYGTPGYSDLQWHIKEHLLFEFLTKWQFESWDCFMSNVTCSFLSDGVSSVSSLLRDVFFMTWERVAWESGMLSDVATVTKGAGLCEGSSSPFSPD